MDNSVKRAARRLLYSLALLGSLGGCAVYDAGYGGYGAYPGVSSYDYYGAPAYPAYPVAPGYGYGYGYGYSPAPFYSGPTYVPAPILQFNYRSGGGYRRHDGYGRGWGGGERRFHDGSNRGQHRSSGSAGGGRGTGGWHGQN